MSKTSAAAFSISSRSTTAERLPPHLRRNSLGASLSFRYAAAQCSTGDANSLMSSVTSRSVCWPWPKRQVAIAFGQFGLANARRPAKQQRRQRPARIVQAGLERGDDLGGHPAGFRLADDPLAEPALRLVGGQRHVVAEQGLRAARFQR